jgi:DNA-binding transcriptional MerR regulator
VSRVERTLLGIGEMARRSGLSVSALRYYDSAGLLVPASVDAASGYRRYRPDQVVTARVLANLRRVDLPLAEVARVLAAATPAEAADVLDRHLGRLEAGLADARQVLSRVRSLLEVTEATTMSVPTLTLAPVELAAAIDQVRFAVSTDPELPALGGVLVETDGVALRLVTTDRFRLAVADAGGRVSEPITTVLVGAAFLDEVRGLLDAAATAAVEVSPERVVVRVDGAEHEGERLEHDFPSYRMLLPTEMEHQVGLDLPGLRSALPDQPGTVTRLAIAGDRLVVVPGDDSAEEDADVVLGVDPAFLLQALAAAGSDQLVLELDGPITPMAIRPVQDTGTFSLLMPVRLDA